MGWGEKRKAGRTKKKKKNKKRNEIIQVGGEDQEYETEKDIIAGAGGLYAAIHLFGKNKGFFLSYFILTWQYIGGGFFTFFIALPVAISMWILHLLFYRENK